MEQCPAPEKLMFEVRLDPTGAPDDTPQSLAEVLSRLSRDEMAKGTLDALGERTFTDGKVRKALDALLVSPPRALMNLVRKSLGNNRLELRQIRDSLHRIAQPGGSALGIGDTVMPAPPRKATKSAPTEARLARTSSKGSRGRSPRQTYDESRHTNGIPQEVISLFRAVERECMALDPGRIEKQPLAKCITFRSGGSTFCSVHLQRGGLRLWLHLKYHHLSNAPPFARDVSKVGHPGGGDLELRIANLNQLPDAARLIRESYLARVGAQR
ncbi:MAG: hypothetical protein FLDDKLPJ_02209 [Phycisphaerae bacterium]|nr:hypothetical protein [Phycisphaerae bacterium]